MTIEQLNDDEPVMNSGDEGVARASTATATAMKKGQPALRHAAGASLRAWTYFVAAGFLVGLADGIWGHSAGKSVRTAWAVGGLSVASGFWLGVLAAIMNAAFSLFASRRLGEATWIRRLSAIVARYEHAFIAALVAVVIGSAGVVISASVVLPALSGIQEVDFARDITTAFVVVVALAFLGGALVLATGLWWLLTRAEGGMRARFLTSRPLAYALLLVVPITLVSLYFGREYAHFLGRLAPLLHACWIVAVAGLVAFAARPIRSFRASVQATILLSASALLFAPLLTELRNFDEGRSGVLSTMSGQVGLSAARTLTDFDRDGASAFFGGGDCAPFDNKRSPGLRDVPDNGIDENCDGKDALSIPATQSKVFFGKVPRDLKRKWNVLWIVIDAVRADRMGYVGSKKKLTPRLDEFAKGSWAFQAATSQSSATLLSFPSMLTGRYPAALDWERKNDRLQPVPSTLTMAEWFKSQGYSTGLVVNTYLETRYSGMQQGYDTIGNFLKEGGKSRKHDKYKAGNSPMVVAKAIEFIEEFLRTPDKPFFLTTYFDDPHAPYVPHKERTTDSKGELGDYESELLFTDRHVGFLLDYLRFRAKLLDNTIVVVTSDHGEEFGERGGHHHARTCHTESVHVPLIVRVPGADPAVVKHPVALVDIAPTLVELIGKKKAPKQLDGQSLLFALEAKENASRPVFCSVLSQNKDEPRPFFRRSVRQGGFALLKDLSRGKVALYNLQDDPAEKHDLSKDKKHAKRVDALERELERSHTGNLADSTKL